MSIRLRLAASLLGLIAARGAPLAAQGVVVAPQGVFIDDRSRGAPVEIYNPNATPVEVTIGTAFGYPVSDSLGRTTVKMIEGADSSGRSAAEWIEAFPRRLTLEPHERRTVRLLARPPQNLPEGEYWTRVLVTARGGTVPVAGAADSGGVRVGLTLEVRTVTAAMYRKGAVRTGVALSNVRAQVAGDSVRVRGRFVREGNAAFIGTARVRLIDAAGRQVATYARPTAVYYSLEPAFSLPVAGLPPGRYTARVEAVAERDDVSRAALLPIVPVHSTVSVVLPPPGR